MRQIGSPAPSPDAKLLLYTISTPDWKEARRQTDIHLVSLEQGCRSTRQMTFTKDKNESEPKWLKDNVSFIFASNREAPASAATQNQLYLMRIDGGEARKITEAKEGVTTFALSHDGKWLVYRSGKAGEEQLYRLPVDGIETADARRADQAGGRPGRLAVGARRQADLLRRPRVVGRRREGAPREEVHRGHQERRDAAGEPLGGRPRAAQE